MRLGSGCKTSRSRFQAGSNAQTVDTVVNHMKNDWKVIFPFESRLLPASGAAWRTQTPHLNPLPLAKRRGEANTMGPTTGGHYRSHRIALKSYRRFTAGNAKMLQP